MATRIYLPSSGSAAVTPSTWLFTNQINPLTFAGVQTKIDSALTTRLQATGTTSPITRAMLRYVIGPLGEQNIGGTIKLQMRAAESNSGANATFAIAAKIIQPNGVDRATLLGVSASDSATSPYEFILTTLTNRRVYDVSEAQPITLTAQDAQAGDYLVIEIGFRSATTTTRNISLRYGDNSANDLPDDTTSTLDYAPYVEFSADITIYSEAYYIIPMVAGPYSRDNKQRPDFVDEIQCNWSGHNVDELGVYVCMVNTSNAKHVDLAGRTGVRQLPRGYTWDTVINTLPAAAQAFISNWCSGKGIPYDATETIGQLLMRIIDSGVFSLGATALTTEYQNLTQTQKDKITALCTKWGITQPTATETVRQIVNRTGPVFWPGNDREKVRVDPF